jgi:hypothetical protein
MRQDSNNHGEAQGDIKKETTGCCKTQSTTTATRKGRASADITTNATQPRENWSKQCADEENSHGASCHGQADGHGNSKQPQDLEA